METSVFGFAKRSDEIKVACWSIAVLGQEFVLQLEAPFYTNLYISIERHFESRCQSGFL